MDTKEAYQQNFAAQLRDWDARVERLNARLRVASAEARIEYETELERLRSQRSAVQGMLAELGRRSENAWTDVKTRSEITWADMNKAMDRMTSHLK